MERLKNIGDHNRSELPPDNPRLMFPSGWIFSHDGIDTGVEVEDEEFDIAFESSGRAVPLPMKGEVVLSRWSLGRSGTFVSGMWLEPGREGFDVVAGTYFEGPAWIMLTDRALRGATSRGRLYTHADPTKKWTSSSGLHHSIQGWECFAFVIDYDFITNVSATKISVSVFAEDRFVGGGVGTQHVMAQCDDEWATQQGSKLAPVFAHELATAVAKRQSASGAEEQRLRATAALEVLGRGSELFGSRRPTEIKFAASAGRDLPLDEWIQPQDADEQSRFDAKAHPVVLDIPDGIALSCPSCGSEYTALYKKATCMDCGARLPTL